jgi:hypothetical protein
VASPRRLCGAEDRIDVEAVSCRGELRRDVGEKAWNFVPRGEQTGLREARTRRLALTTARQEKRTPEAANLWRRTVQEMGQQ